MPILYIIYFVVIAILCGIVYFIFGLLRKKKTGSIIVLILFILALILCIRIVFNDKFFTEKDARSLLGEQNFSLQDDFKILKNQEDFITREQVQSFIIKISDRDKSRLVDIIRNSTNFKDSIASDYDITNLGFKLMDERKIDSIQIVSNYKRGSEYCRDVFIKDKSGRATTTIHIDTAKKELSYLDIN